MRLLAEDAWTWPPLLVESGPLAGPGLQTLLRGVGGGRNPSAILSSTGAHEHQELGRPCSSRITDPQRSRSWLALPLCPPLTRLPTLASPPPSGESEADRACTMSLASWPSAELSPGGPPLPTRSSSAPPPFLLESPLWAPTHHSPPVCPLRRVGAQAWVSLRDTCEDGSEPGSGTHTGLLTKQMTTRVSEHLLRAWS